MDAGVLLAIGSLIFSAGVAAGSFWLSHKTSTAAAAHTAELARDMKRHELTKTADAQIAAYRMQWIADVRSHVAKFYGLQKEINRANFAGEKDRAATLIEVQYPVKQHILMLLKLHSDNPAEVAMEELLRATPLNHEKLHELIEHTRVALKTEWERVQRLISQ